MLAQFNTLKVNYMTTNEQKKSILRMWGKRFAGFVSARGKYISYNAHTWNSDEMRAAWEAARPICEYYKKQSGKPYTLRVIDRRMEAYGNRVLYHDTQTENDYYIEFDNIGD